MVAKKSNGWRRRLGFPRPGLTDFSRDSVDWLAGILEGEGSFQWKKSTAAPEIALKMTDLDIVARVARIFGIKFGTEPPASERHKQTFTARVTGKEALALMFNIFPLMGERRRMKIESLLTRWEHAT